MQLLAVRSGEPEPISVLQVDNKNAGSSILLLLHRAVAVIGLVAILFQLATAIGSCYGFCLGGNGYGRAVENVSFW